MSSKMGFSALWTTLIEVFGAKVGSGSGMVSSELSSNLQRERLLDSSLLMVSLNDSFLFLGKTEAKEGLSFSSEAASLGTSRI